MDCFPPCNWRQPCQRDPLNRWLRVIPTLFSRNSLLKPDMKHAISVGSLGNPVCAYSNLPSSYGYLVHY